MKTIRISEAMTLGELVNEMIDAADAGEVVTADFNGVRLTARPGDTAEYILRSRKIAT